MPDRLEEALGAKPPASVTALPAKTRARLADQVVAARDRQQCLVEEAVDKAIRGVPLPVRGIVKKALTG